MRCLHKTCPMKDRSCPATSTCPEYTPCIKMPYPSKASSSLGYTLYLSPSEAIDMLEKLKCLTAYIDDHANPPDNWRQD